MMVFWSSYRCLLVHTHTPHTGMSWYEAGSCPHAVHLHFVENISFIFISTCISTVFWDQLSILFWLVRLHGFVISSLSHLFPRRVCSHHLLVFIKNFLLFTFKCSVFVCCFHFDQYINRTSGGFVTIHGVLWIVSFSLVLFLLFWIIYLPLDNR